MKNWRYMWITQNDEVIFLLDGKRLNGSDIDTGVIGEMAYTKFYIDEGVLWGFWTNDGVWFMQTYKEPVKITPDYFHAPIGYPLQWLLDIKDHLPPEMLEAVMKLLL